MSDTLSWIADQERSMEPDKPRLNPRTQKLVDEFSSALSEKLLAAQIKYGYQTGWESPNWESECREHLMRHINKGDPRDVAAYCAFMWHHGWSTAQPTEPSGGPKT